MKDTLAMIMAGGMGERLYPLTKHRAKPAVPFGGIYRLIDFPLSNCINSGIRKIAVLTQYKSMSLERHLRQGWNFLNPELDEFIFPVAPQMRINRDWYKGTADSIYQNLYFADMVNPKHFLILSADHIYTMDYSKMLAFHKEKGADVTVAAMEVNQNMCSHFGIMEISKDGRLTGFQEKPEILKLSMENTTPFFANMGIYIFSRETLREVLEEDAQRQSHHDFGKDILPRIVSKIKVYGYNFSDGSRKRPKYWRDVGTLDAYFQANMDMVSLNPELDIYDRGWPIRTYQGQYPPARTVFSQKHSAKRLEACFNSIVSGGCIIKEARVENSILSPRVRIHSHSTVKNSVLMEGAEVGKYSRIRNAILDKGVVVSEGAEIGYNLDVDRNRFYVSDKGIVVVPKGARVSSRQTRTKQLNCDNDNEEDILQGAANWD